MGLIHKGLELDDHVYECWRKGFTPRDTMQSLKRHGLPDMSWDSIRSRFAKLSHEGVTKPLALPARLS